MILLYNAHAGSRSQKHQKQECGSCHGKGRVCCRGGSGAVLGERAVEAHAAAVVEHASREVGHRHIEAKHAATRVTRGGSMCEM